ncbi:hypothetical protein O0235_06435 [Tepidiforma flava]|uniref:Uncharacterized protein n=1 Tax=Tepidiforma flava TaxID=3004094 RepID=A0ABY7M9V1_9CHLR|nr:hypothetical protein [Tepidiforma flava]WBL37200.1 hypothetical protein O0235_06435 [Tepidiforma flava]
MAGSGEGTEAGGWRLEVEGWRLKVGGCFPSPFPSSDLRTPNSQLPSPISHLPSPASRFPLSGSRFPWTSVGRMAPREDGAPRLRLEVDGSPHGRTLSPTSQLLTPRRGRCARAIPPQWKSLR